jgi:hypothetical protein
VARKLKGISCIMCETLNSKADKGVGVYSDKLFDIKAQGGKRNECRVN